MSTDFTALAGALAGGLPDVRACLIVSRDGLVLGSHPASEEARTLGVWEKLAVLGDVERGFAVVGEELWTFARRGAYTALALASPGARAGVILDRLEQILLVAEEARTRRDGARIPSTPIVSTTAGVTEIRGPRTSLHPEVASGAAKAPAGDEDEAPATAQEHQAPAPAVALPTHPENALEIDPIALAREFHGLLMDQDDEAPGGGGA